MEQVAHCNRVGLFSEAKQLLQHVLEADSADQNSKPKDPLLHLNAQFQLAALLFDNLADSPDASAAQVLFFSFTRDDCLLFQSEGASNAQFQSPPLPPPPPPPTHTHTFSPLASILSLVAKAEGLDLMRQVAAVEPEKYRTPNEGVLVDAMQLTTSALFNLGCAHFHGWLRSVLWGGRTGERQTNRKRERESVCVCLCVCVCV